MEDPKLLGKHDAIIYVYALKDERMSVMAKAHVVEAIDSGFKDPVAGEAQHMFNEQTLKEAVRQTDRLIDMKGVPEREFTAGFLRDADKKLQVLAAEAKVEAPIDPKAAKVDTKAADKAAKALEELEKKANDPKILAAAKEDLKKANLEDKIAETIEKSKKFGGTARAIGSHAGKIGATGAVVAGLSLLLPNQQTINDDGTPGEEKWGAGKKTLVFAGGTAAVVGAVAKPTWGKTLKLAEAAKIVEKAAEKAAGHGGIVL